MGDAAEAPRVAIHARVEADLRTITGELRWEGGELRFTDGLATLPRPEDDRGRLRSFPRRVDPGALRFEPAGEGVLRFTTRLPERYGDVGALRGRGLWANGLWYPQPVDEAGHARVVRWDVTVELPAGVVGVLGGEVAEAGPTGALLHHEALADRASLAVLADGVVRTTELGGRAVHLVEHGHGERRLPELVAASLPEGWEAHGAGPVAVVEDLDLTRLATAGPGVVYLSDRAFRLTPPLARYHAVAVRNGLVLATEPAPDGWERAFLADLHTRGLPGADVRKLLGWAAWNPVVEALLHDGTLPFYSDVFDEAFTDPPDPVAALGGRIPGRAAARQVVDLLGEEAGRALALRIDEALAARGAGDLDGEGVIAVLAEAAGVPPEVVAGWGLRYPAEQSYALHVDGGAVHVVRDAPPDAPAEIVQVRVDGELAAPLVFAPGPGERPLAGAGGDAPRRAAVDPSAHVRDVDRVDNHWPARWTAILSGGLYDISPSQGTFELDGLIALRRTGDTRNLYIADAYHDPEDLVGASFTWVRYVGPLLDRQHRAQRLSFTVGPSLLDPSYRPTDAGVVALGGGAGWTWDTRQGDESRTGHRLSVGTGGGFIPGSAESWASAGLSGVYLQPMGPFQVLAGRAGLSWASGDVAHRMLALGGADNLRSVPNAAALGNERAILLLEDRWTVFRNRSVPMGLWWWSGLQLSPGLEAGVLRDDDAPDALLAGVGATLGVHVTVDVVGARPVFLGVVGAVPLWTHGFEADGFQYYLFEFTQSF